MTGSDTEKFSEAIAVIQDPSGADRVSSHIPVTWNTPGGVHGGMLAATAMNAAQEFLGRDELKMRTAHVMFLETPANDLAFDVEVVRQGRGSAHIRVLGNSVPTNRPAVMANVMFSADTESRSWLDATQPEAGDPEDLQSDQKRTWPSQVRRDPTPLLDHIDLRSVPGLVPWEKGWREDLPARYQRWARYVETPWLPHAIDGERAVDPLALVPLADLPTSAIWVRWPIEELPVYYLSLDMWISFFEPIRTDWVLTDIRARWLGEGHSHMETDLWCDGRLVAMSTQTMIRRHFGGEIPTA